MQMARRSTSLQTDIITMILRALIYFSLLKACDATAAFSNIDLSKTTLNPLSTGFMITGSATDYFGITVNTVGDINKDGYDDIMIGAPLTNSNQGAAYVIYGGEKSSMENLDLSSLMLDPQITGFKITGDVAGDFFGNSVSSAGDIDGDGYDDIIVAADGKNSLMGAVYVIYGGDKSSMANILLSTALEPHSTGFMITGNLANGYFGVSVRTAGDINKDGYDDIIVGAVGKNAAYVIYGGEKTSMANILLSTALEPHSTGFMITGDVAGDSFGNTVSTAGDIDGDGYADMIIAAPYKNSNQGAAYVIYGREKTSMSNINLNVDTLYPASTGFKITGAAAGDDLGAFVSTAGDVDNDGYDDIIVGASAKNSGQGVVYVIYGREKSSMSNIFLSTDLDPQTTGFKITGPVSGSYFGSIVGSAGDVNNDGYDDILIGASQINSNTGAIYVIFGGEKASMANLDLSTQALDPLTTGFVVTGNAAGNYFGSLVTTAGDFNNNGYTDIIVGAYGKGAAYLISPAQCSTYCDQCSSLNQCTECKHSYFMYQSGCVASCPNTTFTEGDTCKDCSTHCSVCTSSSVCTECISPSVLYEAQCLSSCPSTLFNSSNVCKSCPSYCFSCTSQSSCQVCYPGYTLANSLCVLSSQGAQQEASQTLASATKGIGSVVSVGSSIFPLSSLVSKIVQNTRYLNLSVTSELAEIYQTWDTNLISWDVPNVMSDLDHFKKAPILFAQYDIDSPFLVNFWPTLINIGIGFAVFITCIMLRRLCEHVKYEGWGYNLVLKLVAGSFNFALVQAYACLDDILFYLVIDSKTNPFNSFFSWMSMICAVIFLAVGCLLVFFNFWTVKKYQDVKSQGRKELTEAFNERNKYWELFYSDFNADDLWSQSFFAILIIRSSLSSLITTVLYDYASMQTTYLIILDGALILFLYFKNPFNTLRGKLAQYYYEIITLLVHICTFILALQDSFETSSSTVRSIMSTGIIYLNTSLITGAIGFMFIEIYKTISQKTRAARNKQRESIPEDTQEAQKLTRKRSRLQPSGSETKEQIHLEPYTNQNRNLAPSNSIDLGGSSQIHESNLNSENSILSENGISQQSRMPILIRHRPITINQKQQRRNVRNPNYIINNE